MYAVILTGGKQYSVKVGDSIFVEKLNAEADSEVTFEKVLAVGEEGAVKVGAPVVEGATVVGKVIKNGKGKKITVFTYKPKKGEKRKMGHRQPYTKVTIPRYLQDVSVYPVSSHTSRRRHSSGLSPFSK